MLIKLPFLVIALGSTLFVVRYNRQLGRRTFSRVIKRSVQSSISAEPFTDKLAGAMSLLQNGKLGEMFSGGLGEKLKGLGKLFSNMMGGGGARSKRSLHSSYMETKANQTNFQRVEMNRTWDKEHEKLETACLVKDNEIYWLEMVVQVLINIMQEMRKVLDGKAIPYKMPKGAYNKTRG